MKKWIAAITATVLLLSLAACGNDTNAPLPESGPDSRTIAYTVTEGDVFETFVDTSYWTMPFAREDDGLLERDGYVLLGYSYDQNGDGDLIRPGHKFRLKSTDERQELYCVWVAETNPAAFTVVENDDFSVSVTAYTGNDETVYIPREIDGKAVTGIAEGAFAGNKKLKEVHITSSVQTVEAGAFSSCPKLETVTVYDTLRTVSDASFEGSPIQTVRLCAGQAPRYMKSLETFGKKYERLIQTAGQKRIVTLAGSSVQYGVDSDYLQTLFQKEYAVVNFGTNGNMNVALFLDAISPLLSKKDVVVFSPEQYGPYAYHVNGNPEMAYATFQGLATCYNLFENINVSDYTGVFTAFAQYCTVAGKMPAQSWQEPNKFLDEYGDLQTLTSDMNSPDFRKGANGFFRFDSTVIPEEYIPHLNRVIDRAKDSGATVVFSYPSLNRNNIEASSLNEEAYASYNEWIAKTVHCKLISDVQDYIYNGEYFYNTDYHLNTVGRELNTKQLAEDLIAAKIGVK